MQPWTCIADVFPGSHKSTQTGLIDRIRTRSEHALKISEGLTTWSRVPLAGRSSLDCKALGDECEFRRGDGLGASTAAGGVWMCLERRHGSKTAAQSQPELEDCW